MHKKISEIGHNITKKHWILYTVLTFIPAIWFSLILSYFGLKLKLVVDVNGRKNFTFMGVITTFLVVAIVFLITLFNNYYSSKSEMNRLEILQAEKIFFERITEGDDRIASEKLDQLEYILPSVKNETSSTSIFNPNHQLKCILEQISNCLCTFMSQPNEEYNIKDFYITLTYNFSLINDNWAWVENTNEKGLSVEEITKKSNRTTFNYLLNSTKPFYINNKKEEAKRQDQYLYDSQDEINADLGNVVGSIFCLKIPVKVKNTMYINSILSISTYQKRFVPDDNKDKVSNARENILKLIRDHFGKSIRIELILLYLEELNKQDELTSQFTCHK